MSRTGTRGRRAGPRTGWHSLTEAELRVARLVALGLSNRAVAAELVLSRHTVDSHLRHIFRKLGVNSRVQVARHALLHETPR
ncbi:response regulator transcription factor [Streptomyces sp. JJ36]|uniref:response regulator transcription factor n=1 Tax=Streptomyces sp. JJ36 TaxID=2736645 RepID=UPI001F16BB2E|nr:helix-turn-helix transcriptional regulator [Streptomyces sp. JJ36]MCF6524118.1 helix-turn-helix transcriptional regulator [Streptomyces sp. JJ36]